MTTVTAKETSTTTAPVVISQPTSSKINWVNIISAIVSIAATFGFVIPTEYQLIAAQILSVFTPFITVILRTWFTGTKPPIG